MFCLSKPMLQVFISEGVGGGGTVDIKSDMGSNHDLRYSLY